ncbi:MAG: hypothetical protein LBL62_09970 [Planctomycetaceae bacterium]|nr:hypothetical protein [Planctomycetaceae bacterium]
MSANADATFQRKVAHLQKVVRLQKVVHAYDCLLLTKILLNNYYKIDDGQ